MSFNILEWTIFCMILFLLHLHNIDSLLLPQNRRLFILDSTAKYLLIGSSILSSPQTANAVENNNETELSGITKLLTGVQYSDTRIGKGDTIQISDTIVLHLRALLRDGSVLFDTREYEDGRPMMYQVGSSENDSFLGGNGSTRSKVTQGVEDAILSRGAGKPMASGGVRKMVVPGPLAYGNAGVSRYDAFQMKLRKGVPRDEILRYEVEILRCLNADLPFTTEKKAEVCCVESNFPCKVE